MSSPLLQLPPMEANADYTEWRNQFMLHRLRLVLLVGIFSCLSFIALNLSRYPEFKSTWLFTNLSQEVVLLLSFWLLHTRFGQQRPSLIFLLLSWSITIIPLYWSLQMGIANFDFVTWTLVFLTQATFIPVRWQLHLLSQLGLFTCFFSILFLFEAPLESQIVDSDSVFLSLYIFWFCVICNIAVYLYERLQYAEFQAKKELQAEQEKSERLLLNILPRCIADRLKLQPLTLAEDFAQATVLFADIEGFTEISMRLSPTKLVELLNAVFSIFDNLVARYEVEKIKTIGDAYMVVAGLPIACDNHASQIAELALDMLQAIKQFKTPNLKLNIRIGIHTGPVIAGVIGIKKFAYDLWGDTVNTASRMESQGIAGQIQVSNETYERLKDKYHLVERGRILIKGKGEMTTYFLLAKGVS